MRLFGKKKTITVTEYIDGLSSCQEELLPSTQTCKHIILSILAEDHMSRDHVNIYLFFEQYIKIK